GKQVALQATDYIQTHWKSTWNGGKPIVFFNQYTEGTQNAPMSSTNFGTVKSYFAGVDSALKGKVEVFIGETGYSSFYTQLNQNTVYQQITTWLNGQYSSGRKTVPVFAFDAFDQPHPPHDVPVERQFGIYGQNGSFKPTGLKTGLPLPTWSKTPIAATKSDF